MADLKEAELKDTDNIVAVAPEKPKTAEKSPKVRKPKTRVTGPARTKADKPKKVLASAATIVVPAISKTVRKNHSEQEKAQKLSAIQKLVSAGESVKGAAKKAGISEQTYYQWKKPSVKNTQSDQLKDLVKLETENAHLKKLLAERLRKENVELKKKLGIS
ncbi:transposase [Mesorhizobium sp. CCNWLW179-1]|uniref:transposase n=1 Tax=unclassified Mesorhizobium TaxID=325217 RepID=UPI0030150F48